MAYYFPRTWSPHDNESEKKNPKTWIDRAIIHASLVDENATEVDMGHFRIIWACCLAGERILALAAITKSSNTYFS